MAVVTGLVVVIVVVMVVLGVGGCGGGCAFCMHIFTLKIIKLKRIVDFCYKYFCQISIIKNSANFERKSNMKIRSSAEK